jgi:hypothetical protein
VREAKDRSSKWLIDRHGGGMLRLAGIQGFTAWRAAAAELTVPKQIPDGLVEVTFPDRPGPVPVLIEISTYPDRRVEEQAIDDVAMVRLARGVVPEVVIICLAPKGDYRIPQRAELRSALGLTWLGAGWNLVEMWQRSAAQLLAANDVGLIPWLPLTQFDEPPEIIVQQCRDRIEAQAPAEEQGTLLAVTQVMTRLRFTDPRLLEILRGSQAMLDSPFMQELFQQRECAVRRQDILDILKDRFQVVPEDVAARVRLIDREERLKELLLMAFRCEDLDAFRKELP